MATDEVFLPRPYRVAARSRETRDVVTLSLEPADDRPIPPFAPGQFNMLYAFGVGEVPISFSGGPDDSLLVHTIRDVGAVTHGLCALDVGDAVGVRGPYGSAWPLDDARGGDLLVIAGGIGLAPLRSAIHAALAERDAFERVAILCGARTPDELLYPAERRDWSERPNVQVLTTVDAAGEHWTGAVGVVPALVARAEFDPARTTALVCGPEVMLRFTVRALQDAGLSADRVHVSLERNMACAVGLCGRCQLGPEFVCMDGPVFAYPRVANLLAVPEL